MVDCILYAITSVHGEIRCSLLLGGLTPLIVFCLTLLKIFRWIASNLSLHIGVGTILCRVSGFLS